MEKIMKKLKRDRGVAGLNILLTVIIALFMIGFLVMIFALMGGELESSLEEDVVRNKTARDVINATYTELAEVTDWYDIIIVITVMVVLVLLAAVVIGVIKGFSARAGGA